MDNFVSNDFDDDKPIYSLPLKVFLSESIKKCFYDKWQKLLNYVLLSYVIKSVILFYTIWTQHISIEFIAYFIEDIIIFL